MSTTINGSGIITGVPAGGLDAGAGPVLATAKTATGTAVDFTDIPGWVKRITVTFNGISTNGTSRYNLRVGTSSGFVTTGYNSSVTRFGSSGAQGATSTSEFLLNEATAASSLWYGTAVFVLAGTNTWAINGAVSNTASQVQNCVNTGTITLTNVLDRIRLTTVNGADIFNAGSINIMYE